jgi:hypothetical protein
VKITTILRYIERSKRIIIDGDAYIIWILQDNADRLSFAVDNLKGTLQINLSKKKIKTMKIKHFINYIFFLICYDAFISHGIREIRKALPDLCLKNYYYYYYYY